MQPQTPSHGNSLRGNILTDPVDNTSPFLEFQNAIGILHHLPNSTIFARRVDYHELYQDLPLSPQQHQALHVLKRWPAHLVLTWLDNTRSSQCLQAIQVVIILANGCHRSLGSTTKLS